MSALSLSSDESLPGGFSLQVDDTTDALVVRVAVAGELDLAGAPALAEALSAAQASAAAVVLDLRGLTFCDTAGLHVVLAADEHARQHAARLVLIPASPAVHRVFELTGMDRRLEFVGVSDRMPTQDEQSPQALTAAPGFAQ